MTVGCVGFCENGCCKHHHQLINVILSLTEDLSNPNLNAILNSSAKDSRFRENDSEVIYGFYIFNYIFPKLTSIKKLHFHQQPIKNTIFTFSKKNNHEY